MKYNFDKIIDRTHTSCVKYDLRQTVFEKQDFGPGGEGFMRMNIACPRSTLTIALGQLERMLSGIL